MICGGGGGSGSDVKGTFGGGSMQKEEWGPNGERLVWGSVFQSLQRGSVFQSLQPSFSLCFSLLI